MDIIIPKQNHFFDKFYRFPHFPNSYYYGIIFSENNYFQRGATIMKILFYDTKSYDREFFEKLLPSYPGIEINSLKQISMKKPQLLPTATMPSVHL